MLYGSAMSEGDGYLRIGELARRTETSPELLRAWEQRYGLIRPRRSGGGFRLYSDQDEARVLRTKALIAEGLSASEAARRALGPEGPREGAEDVPATEGLAAELREALDRFDEDGANRALDRLLAALSLETVIQQVLLPYLHLLGDRWASGEIPWRPGVALGQHVLQSRLNGDHPRQTGEHEHSANGRSARHHEVQLPSPSLQPLRQPEQERHTGAVEVRDVAEIKHEPPCLLPHGTANGCGDFLRIGEVDLPMDTNQADRALPHPLDPREIAHETVLLESRRCIRTTVPCGPPDSSTDSMSSWISGRPWPPWWPDEGRQHPRSLTITSAVPSRTSRLISKGPSLAP